MTRLIATVSVALLVAVAWDAPIAHAGGTDLPGPGAKGLGRAGALIARADDPMALLYNPAGMTRVGWFSSAAPITLFHFRGCFDRAGNYDDYYDPTKPVDNTFGDATQPPPDGYAGVPFPQVCSKGFTIPVPQSAFVIPLRDDLAFGFGSVAPQSLSGLHYAKDDGTVGVPATGLRLPSPGRYQLISDSLLLFYPTVGLAWEPIKGLRFGASFGWGLGFFKFTANVASLAGETLGLDVRNKISVHDLFIPKVQVGVQATPFDRIDVGATFMWQGDISASGALSAVSGVYRREGPFETKKFDGLVFKAPQPWKLGFGIRYAQPLSDTEPSEFGPLKQDHVGDAMEKELFDIEVDATYEHSSSVTDYVFYPPQGPDDTLATLGAPNAPLPPSVVLPHRWKDQLSLAVGSDINVLPGNFTVRLGVSYETRGVQKKYMNLDFWPVQRVGLHGGITQRLGPLDINIAYAYYFQETIHVSQSEAAFPQPVGLPSLGQDPSIVNAGTFTSRVHAFSFGMTTRY